MGHQLEAYGLIKISMLRSILFLVTFISVWSVCTGQTFESRSYYDLEEERIKEIISLRKKDSLPHGAFFSYFQSGKPKINGHYKNGKADSLWVYFYENGNKRLSGFFKNAVQTGQWDYYYESGELKSSGTLERGEKTGFWSNYFENGYEKSTGAYFKDKKEGIWNYFFEDGTLKAQAYYELGNGTYKQFYPSGALRMEGYNKGNKSDGKWTYYFESGEVSTIGEFKDGLRDGKWTYFHENGNLAAEGDYENGNRSGHWKYYHESGSLSSEGDLVNGQKDGNWNLYYESGESKAKGTYELGSGLYTEYYPSGNLKVKGEVLDGKRTGKWIFFNEKGIMDGEAEFIQGRGQYTGYYEDHSIRMEGQMEEDKRIGQWQLYNEDGSLAGVYKPIYEEDNPVFRTIDPDLEDDFPRNPSDKPKYIYKNKSIRYFKKKINEYQGIIFAGNPAWTILNQFPLSVEYYIQERLGYEVQVVYHRKRFFDIPGEELNDPYTRGVTLLFKQKFYQPEGNFGMFYFGHEVAISILNHHANALNQTVLPFERTEIEANEILASYGLFVGVRWLKNGQNSGFTIDTFVGADVGFRHWESLHAPIEDFESVFRSFNQSRLFIPIRFGVNLGWAIRRKTK